MSGAGDGATGLVVRGLAQDIGPPSGDTNELGLWVLFVSLGLGLVLVLLFVVLLDAWSAVDRRRRQQREETLGAAAARIGVPVTADTAVGSLMATPRRAQNPSAADLLSSSPAPERLLEPPPSTIVLPQSAAAVAPRPAPPRRRVAPPPRPLPPSGPPSA